MKNVAAILFDRHYLWLSPSDSTRSGCVESLAHFRLIRFATIDVLPECIFYDLCC